MGRGVCQVVDWWNERLAIATMGSTRTRGMMVRVINITHDDDDEDDDDGGGGGRAPHKSDNQTREAQ